MGKGFQRAGFWRAPFAMKLIIAETIARKGF
jgi:hypothetical protein